MTQINERKEKIKRDLKLLDTHTHTSVVSIFSSALSATFPSPGHSVPRDAGKAPGGAKLTVGSECHVTSMCVNVK